MVVVAVKHLVSRREFRRPLMVVVFWIAEGSAIDLGTRIQCHTGLSHWKISFWTFISKTKFATNRKGKVHVHKETP
ncbi:MAG: hypothetical protein ACYDCP_04155 [Thermoplasmataceae archaeon]